MQRSRIDRRDDSRAPLGQVVHILEVTRALYQRGTIGHPHVPLIGPTVKKGLHGDEGDDAQGQSRHEPGDRARQTVVETPQQRFQPYRL